MNPSQLAAALTCRGYCQNKTGLHVTVEEAAEIPFGIAAYNVSRGCCVFYSNAVRHAGNSLVLANDPRDQDVKRQDDQAIRSLMCNKELSNGILQVGQTTVASPDIIEPLPPPVTKGTKIPLSPLGADQGRIKTSSSWLTLASYRRIAWKILELRTRSPDLRSIRKPSASTLYTYFPY